MDRPGSHAQLAAGRSIESIAREVGRDPSTVAYWVTKHGLVSTHAAKHAARGGIARDELEPLVAAGLTVRAIAERLGVELRDRPALAQEARARRRVRDAPRGTGERTSTILRRLPDARVHRVRATARRTALPLPRAAVSRRSSARGARSSAILVAEAGGRCALCGYDRYSGALQFHHVDPDEKAFALADRGRRASLEAAREEARKCVLLCANCHAEVEAGSLRVAIVLL